MYDHTTEQKKRRLQLASFHKNDLFHTSGNRFIPTIPKSILGASSSTQKSVTKSIWEHGPILWRHNNLLIIYTGANTPYNFYNSSCWAMYKYN